MIGSRFRPHLPTIGLGLVGVALTGLAPAALVALLTQAGRALERGEPLGPWAALTVGLGALTAAATVGRVQVTRGLAWKLAADLRLEVIAAQLNDPVPGGGRALARVGAQADDLAFLVSALVGLCRAPLTLTGLLVVAVTAAPSLVGPALGALLLLALVGRWAAGWTTSAHRRAIQARADLLHRANIHFAAAAAWRDAGTPEVSCRELALLVEADRDARLRSEVWRVLPRLAIQGAALILGLLLLALGASGVAEGRLHLSDLVGFVAALVLGARPAGQVVEDAALWRRSLDTVRRLAPPPTRPVVVPLGPPSIVLEGACPPWGRAEVRDLRLEPGQTLVLVGPSGSGKTTWLRLILGEVAPAGGAVRLLGVDPRDLDPRARAARVGVHRQPVALIPGTLVENVALGRPSGPAELALRRVGLGPPDRRLLDAGDELSAGERQRLGLARAIYGEPPVLLLDEPTAHVDPETGRQLVELLRQLRPTTALVIATHDPEVAALGPQWVLG